MLTGGPLGALAYGGGGLLLNTPAIVLARNKTGVTGTLTGVNAAGKAIERYHKIYHLLWKLV